MPGGTTSDTLKNARIQIQKTGWLEENVTLLPENTADRDRLNKKTKEVRVAHGFYFMRGDQTALIAPTTKPKNLTGVTFYGSVASLNGRSQYLIQAGEWEVTWPLLQKVCMKIQRIDGFGIDTFSFYRDGAPALCFYTNRYVYILLQAAEFFEPDWNCVVRVWEQTKSPAVSLVYSDVNPNAPRPSWWHGHASWVGFRDWCRENGMQLSAGLEGTRPTDRLDDLDGTSEEEDEPQQEEYRVRREGLRERPVAKAGASKSRGPPKVTKGSSVGTAREKNMGRTTDSMTEISARANNLPRASTSARVDTKCGGNTSEGSQDESAQNRSTTRQKAKKAPPIISIEDETTAASGSGRVLEAENALKRKLEASRDLGDSSSKRATMNINNLVDDNDRTMEINCTSGQHSQQSSTSKAQGLLPSPPPALLGRGASTTGSFIDPAHVTQVDVVGPPAPLPVASAPAPPSITLFLLGEYVPGPPNPSVWSVADMSLQPGIPISRQGDISFAPLVQGSSSNLPENPYATTNEGTPKAAAASQPFEITPPSSQLSTQGTASDKDNANPSCFSDSSQLPDAEPPFTQIFPEGLDYLQDTAGLYVDFDGAQVDFSSFIHMPLFDSAENAFHQRADEIQSPRYSSF